MEVNPNKTGHMRVLGAVDVSKLVQRIQALSPEQWDRYDTQKPNKYPSLKDTQHVVLKFSDKTGSDFRYYETDFWQDWEADVVPVLEEAVRPYGYASCVFPRVMIAKLPPGKKITPHMDGPHHESRPHKIHVPLLTNPDAKFLLPPDVFHFESGKAYEVNNGKLHGVANNGSTDRIHLIFEMLEATE